MSEELKHKFSLTCEGCGINFTDWEGEKECPSPNSGGEPAAVEAVDQYKAKYDMLRRHTVPASMAKSMGIEFRKIREDESIEAFVDEYVQQALVESQKEWGGEGTAYERVQIPSGGPEDVTVKPAAVELDGECKHCDGIGCRACDSAFHPSAPAAVPGFEEWWTDLYGAPHPNGPSQENKDFAELGWDNAIQALLKDKSA